MTIRMIWVFKILLQSLEIVNFKLHFEAITKKKFYSFQSQFLRYSFSIYYLKNISILVEKQKI